MLGFQSERQVQQLLSDLARIENRSEDTRQQLARVFDFNPRNAFQRLDRSKNYSLSAFEVKDFLRDTGKFVTSSEVGLLFQQFDSDHDGKLSRSEFEDMILPQTDRLAREHTYTRREQYVGRFDNLPREQEYLLSDIIYNEIQGLLRLESDLNSLKRRYDYSRFAVFKALDSGRIDSVSRSDVQSFINRAGGYARFSDVDAIFRRIDSDKDGILRYGEIAAWLDGGRNGGNCNRPEDLAQSSASRNSSPLRASQTENNWRSKSAAGGPRGQSSLYNYQAYSSPLRASSPAKKQDAQQEDFGASAGKSTTWGTPSPNKQAQQEEDSATKQELQPRKLDMEELDEASPEEEAASDSKAAGPAEAEAEEESKEAPAKGQEEAVEEPASDAQNELQASPEPARAEKHQS